MQGDIGDTQGRGGGGGKELGKKLSFVIVIGVQNSCSSPLLFMVLHCELEFYISQVSFTAL